MKKFVKYSQKKERKENIVIAVPLYLSYQLFDEGKDTLMLLTK